MFLRSLVEEKKQRSLIIFFYREKTDSKEKGTEREKEGGIYVIEREEVDIES